MTKVDTRVCDVCGDPITKRDTWAKFKQRWSIRVFKWGIQNLSPVSDGWIQSRFDLCENCWTETIDIARSKVNDD